MTRHHRLIRENTLAAPLPAGSLLARLLAGISAAFLAALLLSGPAPAEGLAGGGEDAADIPAGLYFKVDDSGRALQAPTLKSNVSVAVSGMIARVTLRQHFYNPTALWLEGTYIFPLPELSAVDRLVMEIGGRRVEGKIMEKAEAKKAYDAAAAKGQRASLLSAKRPNVFASSVANIPPGEEIVIEIEYQDVARYDSGRFSYRFPMVVAPRYSPQLPEVAQAESNGGTQLAANPAAGYGEDLFGPVRDPDRTSAHGLSLTVMLDPGLPLQSLRSLYHQVSIETQSDHRQRINLARGVVPATRDFVLEWQPKLGAEPEAAAFAEEVDGSSHVMVMMLPPPASQVTEDAGKEINSEGVPRDVILVIDTSGSMSGASMAQAKDAVLLALKRLLPGDRFNIIRFSDTTDMLFQAAATATAANVARGWHFVQSLEANGGTEMAAALALALHRNTAEDSDDGARLRQVVFVTDGAVSNENQLFRNIAEQLGSSRLFTVGIGSAPNSYFMRKTAEIGRGDFIYIGEVKEVAERMTTLFQKLETPLLTDIVGDWPLPAGLDAEVFPAVVPDLYSGQPVIFTARLAGLPLAELRGDLRVTGKSGGRSWARRLSLRDVEPAPGVAAIWARAKIEQIEDGRHSGRNPAAIRDAALKVALEHRLVTRYTSLVAIDDAIARPPDAPLNSKDIARDLPHGWDYEKVFGPKLQGMKLRALPADLLDQRNGEPVSLPRGASDARLLALRGLAALLLGLLLLVFYRRKGLEHAGPRGA